MGHEVFMRKNFRGCWPGELEVQHARDLGGWCQVGDVQEWGGVYFPSEKGTSKTPLLSPVAAASLGSTCPAANTSTKNEGIGDSGGRVRGICDYRKVISRALALLGQQDFPAWVTQRMEGGCILEKELSSLWPGWPGLGKPFCLIY